VQVPLLAAQNAVPLKDEAVTSSTMTFFQSIGGLLGAAVMQTVLNNRLTQELAPIFAKLAALGGGGGGGGDFDVRALKPFGSIYNDTLDAFGRACGYVFWVCVAGAVITTLASFAMEHVPLKGGAEAAAADAAAAKAAELAAPPSAAAPGVAVREPAPPAV